MPCVVFAVSPIIAVQLIVCLFSKVKGKALLLTLSKQGFSDSVSTHFT
jgi:hypothetical protein